MARNIHEPFFYFFEFLYTLNTLTDSYSQSIENLLDSIGSPGNSRYIGGIEKPRILRNDRKTGLLTLHSL